MGKSATITENFAADPLAHGWQIYGDTNLFRWNSMNQNLAVTWDSSQTNSYFYLPLGTILTKSDAFSLAFDLQLSDIADNSPQIAVGLFNFANPTNANFTSCPAATQFPKSFRVRLFRRQWQRSAVHRRHVDRHQCEFYEQKGFLFRL